MPATGGDTTRDPDHSPRNSTPNPVPRATNAHRQPLRRRLRAWLTATAAVAVGALAAALYGLTGTALAAAGAFAGCGLVAVAVGRQPHTSWGQLLGARRPALAQTQLLILGAVIAAIIVLSVGGFAVYRSVTRGAEDNATKTNVDRVLAAAEDYWQQFALDRSGIREAEFNDLCDYFNSQFTIEDDLILRSLGVGELATAAPAAALGPREVSGKGGAVQSSEGGLAASGITTADRQRATCGNPTEPLGYDVHFVTNANDTPPVRALSNWQDLEFGSSSKQKLALGSTRGVFVGSAVGFPHATSSVPGLPKGTVWGTETIIVGAVSSSGNSFCAIKVFDADDRSHVGNYRYSSAPDAAGPVIPAPCLAGIPGADITGGEADSGWKAAS